MKHTKEQILEAKWKSFDDSEFDTEECEKARQEAIRLGNEHHLEVMKSVKARFEPIIFFHDYVEEGYGYKKETPIEDEGVQVHWISLYEDSIQIYSYNEFDGESEDDKEYDTGMVSMNETELETLIKVLTS